MQRNGLGVLGNFAKDELYQKEIVLSQGVELAVECVRSFFSDEVLWTGQEIVCECVANANGLR